MGQIVKQLSLEIRSNLGDVSLLAAAIHAVCSYVGLDQNNASLVELSIVEAVTNSIKHAYHGEPDHRLNMTIVVNEQLLRFDLFDSGTSMTAEHVDRLVQGGSVAESRDSDNTSIPENGRGLEIIHQTMDEIAYSRESGQNHLMLAVRLGESKATKLKH
jgi:serine/threonine-protein kinase RsbW